MTHWSEIIIVLLAAITAEVLVVLIAVLRK
jgi:hypothetical protein